MTRKATRRMRVEWNEIWNKAHADGYAEKRRCADRPDLYVDYASAPTADEAELLCQGCPFYQLCQDYADSTKPAWGVWGGRRWRHGEKLAGPKRTEVIEEIAA